MDTVPDFHAEAPQATVSEGLSQGPYVAAKAGVAPMTLWTKGVDSTKAPPRPTYQHIYLFQLDSFVCSSLDSMDKHVLGFD